MTVLEDLRPQGYRLCRERAALDKQHATLALRALGRLHALSHAAKVTGEESRGRQSARPRLQCSLSKQCTYFLAHFIKFYFSTSVMNKNRLF